jgi:hypothetical protein
LDGPIENLAALLLVARQPTLAYLLLFAMRPTLAVLLLVAMVTNSTGVVSVSMEIFNYGCLVTAAFGQTRHNIMDIRGTYTVNGYK